MKRTILHSIALCLTVCSLLSLAACHSELNTVPVEAEEASLYLNIAPLGQTRASTDDLTDNEMMKSLRVIVLHADGTVEHNHYSVSSAGQETKYIILKVTPNETKRIFLFANEESVSNISSQSTSFDLSGSLKDFLAGVNESTTDVESKIASIYYTPDFSQPIPLSAMYDVEIPAGEKHVAKKFWLVRVATKFTFTFINNRMYEDLTINSFKIHGLSDRHFLMPRFTDNKVPVFSGFDNWIDWLKDVSDKTQVDPDNPTADASGWLTGYDIPEAANTVDKTYNQSFTLEPVRTAGAQGGGREISNLYCCESKHLRTEGENKVLMEQQYTVHIDCTSGGEQKSFDIPLPNLRSLFRNTHPHVIMTMKDELFDVKAVVDVVPYRGCILDPYFGLNK